MTEFLDWEDIRAELDDGDEDALAAERARTEAWVSAVSDHDLSSVDEGARGE